jgi:hypothetical protein
VAELGVNYISVGALTHSAPCADISLLFEEVEWSKKFIVLGIKWAGGAMSNGGGGEFLLYKLKSYNK